MKENSMWNRLMFGKKYVRESPEGKIRILKRNIYLFEVYMILLFVALFYLFIFRITEQYNFQKEYNLTLDFSDLNAEEKEIVTNYVSNLKEIYLMNQKTMTFSKNITKYYPEKYNVSEFLLGFNDLKGNIYVLYRDDAYGMKRTVCHELLHSFGLLDKERNHAIVYDLANYLPCYENAELNMRRATWET